MTIFSYIYVYKVYGENIHNYKKQLNYKNTKKYNYTKIQLDQIIQLLNVQLQNTNTNADLFLIQIQKFRYKQKQKYKKTIPYNHSIFNWQIEILIKKTHSR